MLVVDAIPTVDLSAFLSTGDADGRKHATKIICEACRAWGLFRIVNHGVPLELMARAIELSKAFFDRPYEEKLAWRSVEGSGAPLPVGYARRLESAPDKNERLMMLCPESRFNVYPDDPPEFRDALDECFTQLTKTALLMEDILNECMGLPPNFLKEYNDDRSSDFMVAVRYFPATAAEKAGAYEHQDGSCISFLFQDNVRGLQAFNDGEWIPVSPVEGSIVVIVGDIIQVLSNGKFKSPVHRVVSSQSYRHSYVFSYNLGGEKWVEPLPELTTASEVPEYRGFVYKDYLRLRMRNKTHPPSNPKDSITISHYAISG